MADPDETFTRDPQTCHGCGGPLSGAPVFDERRHQVFDAPPPPPRPHVTEYRIVSRTCSTCGTTSEGEVPAWARGRVQYGPKLPARAVWLMCAHHLPVRRRYWRHCRARRYQLAGLLLCAAGPPGCCRVHSCPGYGS